MKKVSLIIFYFVFASLSFANIQSDSLANVGMQLFKSNCKACHNIDKNLVGPALSKVYERRDSAWIYNFVKNSQKMIAQGDSTATSLYEKYNEVIMPNQKLSNEEIKLIINYIKNEDTGNVIDGTNPIQRPVLPVIDYNNHFRFSNYLFWIPFTLSIILGMCFLYYMTYFSEIVEDYLKDKETLD